jgi:outer membrane usher protein FimD/PapC
MQRLHKNKKKGIALAISLLLGSATAFAAGEEGMFLDIKVNQQQRGEFAVYRNAEGDFFVRLPDFPQLGLKRDISLPRVRIAGENDSYVSLRDLGAIRLDLDTARLALDVELPPEVFDTTAIDLSRREANNSLGSEQRSGFLNYRLADSSYGIASSTRTLATELGLRAGSVLLLNQSLFRENAPSSRYLTQLVYDRPEVQQRYVAGDFVGSSGELGSSLSMGGLNLSKVYSMAPDLVRQPLGGFAGVATSPSQVEVRVGGVPVAYSEVGAGPFELQNLRQYGGSSDVQVMVRDALGREQVYDFPFYYSEQSLRQGLHEYSYSLGKLRTNPGTPAEDYGKTAFSAFHRYGYSDALTVGGRAESADDLNNVGVSATWRSDQWGVLAGGASASNYKSRAGDATLLSYAYQQPQYGVRGIARRYSADYAPLETLVYNFQRSGEYGVNLSWHPAAGTSLSFNHTLTQWRDKADGHITSLNLYQHLSTASFLYATLQRTDDSTRSAPNTSLFVGWQYRFGGKYSTSVNATGDEAGHQTLSTQLARDIPYGDGFGYRVGWTGTQPENTDRFNGYAQWNLPAVSLSLDANTLPAQGSRSDYRELAAAGAVAFAGSGWGFTRQINDSFAIVQMGAAVPGVHVMANSQDIGASNDSGQVISPYLGSFY